MQTKTYESPSHAAPVLALLGACVLAVGAGRAVGADVGHSQTNIRYNDLNLSTAQGAKSLYARIEKASYEVCRHYDRDSRDNADPASLQGCRKKAIADAVTKIGKPMLYAEYNARNAPPIKTQIVTAQVTR